MKKAYFLIVLILCGLSVGNVCASASAAAAAEEAAAAEGYLGEELIEAAARSDKAKVEELLARGADVNAVNQYGYTALRWAVIRGHENIVDQLLQAGADVNAVYQFERTALMEAALIGRVNIVKLLLDAGADKDMQNRFGNTAENIARANHHDAVTNMIRDYRSGRRIKAAR